MNLHRLRAPQQDVVGRMLQVGVEVAAEHVAQQRPDALLHLEHEVARRVRADLVHVRLAAAAADHEALQR